MAGEPSISFRKSIRWLVATVSLTVSAADDINQGEDPSEPTSTLVLTTSEGYYVDIRVLLPPNFSGDGRFLTAEPNTLKIDWAFAGTASSSDDALGYETLMNQKPRKCTWTHWIDSHKPSGFQDSGSMYKQADGTILEVGKMVNPGTGEETPYEEVWEDPVPQIIHPWKEGEMTRAARENQKTGKAVCHAIDLDEEGKKGMIIRVGDWVQGLRIEGESEDKRVTVERWHWTEAEDPKGEWKLRFKIGDGELPCWYVMGEDGEYNAEWPEGHEKWSMVSYELFQPA